LVKKTLENWSSCQISMIEKAHMLLQKAKSIDNTTYVAYDMSVICCLCEVRIPSTGN